jgi:hypothetical protein
MPVVIAVTIAITATAAAVYFLRKRNHQQDQQSL